MANQHHYQHTDKGRGLIEQIRDLSRQEQAELARIDRHYENNFKSIQHEENTIKDRYRTTKQVNLEGLEPQDINSQEQGSEYAPGYTALMHAVSNGYASIVEQLLLAGANPNIKNMKGETALFIAVTSYNYNSSTEIVQLLLQHNADPTLRYCRTETNPGRTVLDMAVASFKEVFTPTDYSGVAQNSIYNAREAIYDRQRNEAKQVRSEGIIRALLQKRDAVFQQTENSNTRQITQEVGRVTGITTALVDIIAQYASAYENGSDFGNLAALPIGFAVRQEARAGISHLPSPTHASAAATSRTMGRSQT